MSRALVVIQSAADREKVCRWARGVPAGTRIEFKETKRTIPQSDRMWAMLTDIARQLTWHGMKLDAEDYKLILLDGLKRELRLVPNMHGNGFVNLGRSSSDLSKAEMSDFMELIAAFGAEHGVVFHDEKASAA